MPDRSLLLRASLGLERCERTGRPRLTKTSLRACVFHGCALGNHGVWPGLRPNWRLENFHTTPRRPSVECRSRSAGFPLLDLQGMASRSIVGPQKGVGSIKTVDSHRKAGDGPQEHERRPVGHNSGTRRSQTLCARPRFLGAAVRRSEAGNGHRWESGETQPGCVGLRILGSPVGLYRGRLGILLRLRTGPCSAGRFER
jgi:hypothetical protein